MEIDAANFITIMSSNFKLPIVETNLGKGIKMNCFDAFIYATITGAGYLDDPLYQFTPKSLTKLFYNALDYKFVTGIFDNTTIKNTPLILSKSKTYLFEEDKIIVPVEFNTELELQAKLKKFIKNTNKPTNYLIQRIEISKKGNGMEPFMEYLACETMKKEDFIVENQIPLSYSSGSPDFGGYRIGHIVPFNRIHLIELALIRLGRIPKMNNQKNPSFCIVGEAKTSTTQMKKQIEKYIKTQFFNEAYEILPYKIKKSNTPVNTITIDSNNIIKIIKSQKKQNFSNKIKQAKYVNWLSNYIKYYLIANLTNDEFNEFYLDKKKCKIAKVNDIIDFVNSLSYSDILSKIEAIHNGSI